MPRLDGPNDDGAIAVLVALMLGGGLLIGLLALVADTGTLMLERRTQQSAADAASLALAQRCAELSDDCSDAKAASFAGFFATNNSPDGLSRIVSICTGGVLATPITSKCATPTSSSRLDCGAAPTIDRYARVVTGTSLSSGNLISPLIYQIRGTGGGYSLKGCSQTAWGKAAGATVVMPLAFPLASTSGAGVQLYVDRTGVTLTELTTAGGPYFCTSTSSPPCPTPIDIDGRSVKLDFLPKGFGFISVGTTATLCTQSFRVLDYVPRITTPSKLCDSNSFSKLLGVPSFIPAISEAKDTGNGNWQFKIAAFFRFKLTGYKVQGLGQGGDVPVCANGTSCIKGDFGRGVVPGETVSNDPNVPNLGAQAVELIP